MIGKVIIVKRRSSHLTIDNTLPYVHKENDDVRKEEKRVFHNTFKRKKAHCLVTNNSYSLRMKHMQTQ